MDKSSEVNTLLFFLSGHCNHRTIRDFSESWLRWACTSDLGGVLRGDVLPLMLHLLPFPGLNNPLAGAAPWFRSPVSWKSNPPRFPVQEEVSFLKEVYLYLLPLNPLGAPSIDARISHIHLNAPLLCWIDKRTTTFWPQDQIFWM